MDSFADRLRILVNESGKKQSEICAGTGIEKGLLSHYLTGDYKAKSRRLHILAKYFDVSEAWLMGFDVPRERTQTDEQTAQNMELDEHEYAVIQALRSQPEMREAVDRLLGIK